MAICLPADFSEILPALQKARTRQTYKQKTDIQKDIQADIQADIHTVSLSIYLCAGAHARLSVCQPGFSSFGAQATFPKKYAGIHGGYPAADF